MNTTLIFGLTFAFGLMLSFLVCCAIKHEALKNEEY